MFRTLTLIAAIGLFVVAPARTATPFRAAALPIQKNRRPDTPQKIIEELRLNFDRVGSDKLLEQDEPEPNKKQDPT